MRRLIWLPIAGFLLVGGAAIAAAASAPSITPSSEANQDTASPQPSAAASPSTTPDSANPLGKDFGHGFFGAGADILDQVLADLVKAGTITQAQSDAITQALQQKITDQQARVDQMRQQAQQEWTQLQGFLQDGVITQDEVNQLPADSPFRKVFDSIAQNGQVTLDQLRQLRMFGRGDQGDHGNGWGPGSSTDNDQDQNPDASPSTTGTSS